MSNFDEFVAGMNFEVYNDNTKDLLIEEDLKVFPINESLNPRIVYNFESVNLTNESIFYLLIDNTYYINENCVKITYP